MRILVMLALLVLCAWLIAYLASDEFDQAAMTGGSRGHINSGAKFGIYVGMPMSHARQILSKRGLTFYERASPSNPTPPHACLGRRYPANRHIEVWADDSWRRGTICLSSTEEKVVSVAWHFNPVPAP